MFCPDCGERLATSLPVCDRCGLDVASQWARQLGEANAMIHRSREAIDDARRQEQLWLAHRETLRAGAPRVVLEPLVEVIAAKSSPAPQSSPAPLPNPAVASATQQVLAPPRIAAAAKPRRKVSAATLLGISGAALLIVAGIVFVAASWSTYVPVVRMVILLAFAGGSVWLAKLAQRASFVTMAASLGIVGAGFAGVSVYALRYDDDAVGPFTTPIALAAAAAVAFALSRWNLNAVIFGSALATLGLVHAAAIEAAVRTQEPFHAASVYALIAGIGALLTLVGRRAWGQARGVMGVGALVLVGAAMVSSYVALGAQVEASAGSSHGGFWQALLAAGVAGAAAVTSCVLEYRATLVAPFVSAHTLVVVAAVGFEFGLNFEWVGTIVVLAALALAAATRLIAEALRRPVLYGAALASVALVWVAIYLPLALLGALTPLAGSTVSGSTGLAAAATVTTFALAALQPLLRSWLPLAQRRGAIAACAVLLATAVMSAGLVVPHAAWPGPASTIGAVLGASALWLIAERWLLVQRAYRLTAISVTAWMALVQIIHLARGNGVVPWIAWLALAVAIAALVFAARHAAHVELLLAVLISGIAAASTLRFSQSLEASFVAAAVAFLVCGAASIFGPAKRRGARRIGLFALGLVPAVAVAVSGLVTFTLLEAVRSFVGNNSLISPWLVPALAATILLSVPVTRATLAYLGRAELERRVVVTATAGLGLTSLAIWLATWAPTTAVELGAGATHGELHVQSAVTALAFGAVWALSYVPWWAPGRSTVHVAGVIIVTLHGVLEAVFLSAGDVPAQTLIALAISSLALLAAAWWRPAVGVGPLVLTVTLAVMSLVWPYGNSWSGLVGVGIAATVVWSWALIRRSWRVFVIVGAAPVLSYAAVHLLWLFGCAFVSLFGLWFGNPVRLEVLPLLEFALAVAAAHAFTWFKRRSTWLVVLALAPAAAYVPAPIAAAAVMGVAAVSVVLDRFARGRTWQGRVTVAHAVALTGIAIAWIGQDKLLLAAGFALSAALHAAAMTLRRRSDPWAAATAATWPLLSALAVGLAASLLGGGDLWAVLVGAVTALLCGWWMWLLGYFDGLSWMLWLTISLPMFVAQGAAAFLVLDAGLDIAGVVMTAIAGVALWMLALRRRPPGAVVLGGSAPALILSVVHLMWLSALSAQSCVNLWSGKALEWELVHVGAIALGVVALLSRQAIRRQLAWLLLVSFAIAAGFVVWPVAALALAVLCLACAVFVSRGVARGGVGAPLFVALSTAAAVWAGPSMFVWSIVISAVAVGLLAMALSAVLQGGPRVVAALVWPFFAGSAVMTWAHVAQHSWQWSLLVAQVLVLAGVWWMWSLRRFGATVMAWSFGVVTALVPAFSTSVELAGLSLLLSSAAWYAVSTRGLRFARWLALGLLTPAAACLVFGLGVTALEAYTAVPAASMILGGLWWMKRDPSVRTYKALAPGLGLALVPSYVALVVFPNPLPRLIALLAAIVLLALVGVSRRWFAPLLATAITAIVLSATQVVADQALVSRWIAVAFIGAILTALGFTAEKIKTMR